MADEPARRYEVMLLLDPRNGEERDQQILDNLTALVERVGGTDLALVPWGTKRLAFPVDKQLEGTYVVATFSSSPDGLAEIERIVRITEGVMRHVAVLLSSRIKQAPVPGADTPHPGDAVLRESDRRTSRSER